MPRQKNVVVNDFTSSPDQLLDIVLNEQTEWGTDFAAALQAGQEVMADNWSTERTPIMIFLSDGEGSLPETEIQDLCRSAIQHGPNLQRKAPADPLFPAAARVPSSFTSVLDTVRLAETFLGIAESLRKTRGSLMR
ncbi:hypothetical protein EDB86DRAFT_3067749 [Lactarius hatsudake]|nr:hypothetical protein EDB86DRAFT_3067749 [Lactarius hatsudake]